MKKLLKTGLACALAINIFSSTALAENIIDQESKGNLRAPVETYVDGKLYIDGIPYYTNQDIDEFSTSQLDSTKMLEKSSSPISLNGINKWTLTGSSNYYTGHDYDRFNNNSSNTVKRTFSATSKMYGEISGSTKFNFAKVAEASMTLKVGQEYEKTTSIEYSVKPWHVAELKSACKGIKRDYAYTDTGLIWDTTYYASSYDNNRGVEYWLFENPIN